MSSESLISEIDNKTDVLAKMEDLISAGAVLIYI